MPPRFVEVLDVASEASNIFAHAAASVGAFASEVRVNVSEYINVNTSEYDINLVAMLRNKYNLSTEDVLQTLTSLNLHNSTIAHVPPPSGMAGWLIAAGLLVLVLRAVIVRWQARKLVRQYGHAHAE